MVVASSTADAGSAALLVRPTSSLPPPRVGPDEAIEWVFHVRPTRTGATFDRSEVTAIFGPEWAEEVFAGGHVSVYARETANGPWTRLEADDDDAIEGDDAVEKDENERDERDAGGRGYVSLVIAADLVRFFRKPPTQTILQAFADAVKETVADLGGIAALRENAQEAAARAKELGHARRQVGEVDVSLLVVAPGEAPFEARALAEALTELDLVLVDGDAYYWENAPETAGDPWLFRVDTATEDEVFSLEAIEAAVTYDSLVFALDVARTAAPTEVAAAMLKAARYVATKLGGEVLDDEGNVLDDRVLLGRVEGMMARVREAGFTPGSDASLRLF